MCHGHLHNSRREYVITRLDTPLPWIYYLGTGTFFGVIPNTASGYSCYRDARVTQNNPGYNGVPADSGGRHLYLRDNGSRVRNPARICGRVSVEAVVR